MGRYVSAQDIKDRLVGKIRFTSDPNDQNKVSNRLFSDLVTQAESHVEMDLSPRYGFPFVSPSGVPFAKLPSTSTTKNVILMLLEIQCILLILEYGFGEASAIDGAKYALNLSKRYDFIVKERILKLKDQTYHTWIYPPLPDLALNYQNRAADIGFLPPIEVTSSRHGDFSPGQINDPGQDFWFGDVENIHE